MRLKKKETHFRLTALLLCAVMMFSFMPLQSIRALADSTDEPAYTCGKAEHIHGPECYETQRVLACGLEEESGPGDGVPEPGAEETEPDAEEEPGSDAAKSAAEDGAGSVADEPAESEAGTDTGSEAAGHEEDPAADTAEGSESAKPHVHTDACYEDQMILTCSIEEHIHTDSCLTRSGDDPGSESLDSVNSIEMGNAELDTASAGASDYEIAFKNTAIGLYETGTDMIPFTISCPGADVTASEMSVASDGEGRFGLSFPVDGDYTAEIRCSGSGAGYKCDARTLVVSLQVTNGAVTERSRAFVLGGEQTGTQGSFITTYRLQSSWSAGTMAKAREIMAGMTLEEKVGQLFLVHYPGDGSGSIAQAADRINKWHPGGYLVFGAMFKGSTPDTVRAKVAAAQAAAKIPMFFSVDEEGGKVVRISSNAAFRSTSYQSPQSVSSGGTQAVYDDAADKAAFLSDLGMNLNHAPVADVSGSSGFIYPRTYGGDGLYNARFVAEAVRGHEENGVGSTLKHFPGYGGTTSDTHNGFAVNNISRAEFDYNDLLPFYEGLAAGGKSVMVTHNIINCMDPENPASLSAGVISVLRNDMGFDGLVMTDDLDMNGVGASAEVKAQASLRCLLAGVDMPMTSKPDEQIPIVLAAVEDGTLPVSHVEESCLRVLAWKIEKGLIKDGGDDPGPDVPIKEDEAQYTSADGSVEESGTFEDMWALAVNNGGTVTMLADVDTAGDKTVSGHDVTLDLHGHKLNFISGTNGFIVNGSSRKFTIRDTVGEMTEETESAASIGTPAGYNAVRRILTYYTIEHNVSDASPDYVMHTVDMDTCGSVSGNNTGIMIEVTNGGHFVLEGGVLSHKVRAVECVNSAKNVIEIRGGAIVNCGTSQGGTTVNGSGIGVYGGGMLKIYGGYIGGNGATTRGGGIVIDSGSMEMYGGAIAANNTKVNGGGVYLFGGTTLKMSGGTVACNTAGSNGGGIYGISANIQLGKSDSEGGDTAGEPEICCNESGNGGGVFVYNSSASIAMYNGWVMGNKAKSDGGGFGVAAGGENLSAKSFEMAAGTVAYNSADGSGGGLFVNNTGVVDIAGIVEYNTAGANGGGIAVENQSNAVMQNVVAAHNTAGGNGGGIYLDVSSKTMTLGGTPRITANQGGNLYLRSGAAVKLYGILGGSSVIGISTEVLPTDAVPVQIGVANTSDGNYLYNSRSMFRSDNAAYSVSFRDAALYLVEGSGSHTGTSVEVNGILFQYYANLMEISDVGEASRRLDVIDTSGAVLPSNGVAPSIRYLYLNADGSVVREKKLKPVYAPRDVPENDFKSLANMNRFLDCEGYYYLKEVWVATSGTYGGSTDPLDWTVYPYTGELNITTNAAEVTDGVIYVEKGYVIRFVADPTEKNVDVSAVFYDYDISNGEIYASLDDAKTHTNGIATSEQDGSMVSKKVYTDTRKAGINSDDNYGDLSKALLAFGNANTQNGRDYTGGASQKVDGFTINTGNRGQNNFKLCSFGIVTGVDSNGHLIYNDKISAPNLFDEGPAAGKTPITGHTVGFVYDGGMFMFDNVGGTNAVNLSTFGHPGSYTNIWTNNFWPMDDMGTFGTDGHDLKFGSTVDKSKRKIVNYLSGEETDLPTSDDGTDHNAYFGMQFAIRFDLESDYIGPLDYQFFGDDDMWVFLDDTLICDIGGVHSAAGSYTNLWDYLTQGEAGTHTLKFFFTERGASGSTCWMALNVPNLKSATDEEVSYPGTLKIQKSVEGIETDEQFEFTVTIDLLDGQSAPLNGEYAYTGSKTGTIMSGGKITLANGEYVIIQNLPSGATYSVVETEDSRFETTAAGNVGTIGFAQSTATFVNIFVGGPRMPKTGGSGTGWIMWTGACWCLTGLLLIGKKKQRF